MLMSLLIMHPLEDVQEKVLYYEAPDVELEQKVRLRNILSGQGISNSTTQNLLASLPAYSDIDHELSTFEMYLNTMSNLL